MSVGEISIEDREAWAGYEDKEYGDFRGGTATRAKRPPAKRQPRHASSQEDAPVEPDKDPEALYSRAVGRVREVSDRYYSGGYSWEAAERYSDWVSVGLRDGVEASVTQDDMVRHPLGEDGRVRLTHKFSGITAEGGEHISPGDQYNQVERVLLANLREHLDDWRVVLTRGHPEKELPAIDMETLIDAV